MDRKGFAPIVILLIMAVVLVVVATSYFLFRNHAPYVSIPISATGIPTIITAVIGSNYHILSDEDVSFTLTGSNFLNIFPETLGVYSPHAMLVGKLGIYDVRLLPSTCHRKYYMIGDVGSESNTDCGVSITKISVDPSEAIIKDLRPYSVAPQAERPNMHIVEGNHFVYIYPWPSNYYLELVSNFGSYYAGLPSCSERDFYTGLTRSGKIFKPIEFGPEILQIVCNGNEYILNVSYKEGITEWPAKIVSFEPAPAMFTHGPLLVSLQELNPPKPRTKDEIKILDLQKVQHDLKTYFDKCGSYPGGSSVVSSCAKGIPADWLAMSIDLVNANIGVTYVPGGPVTGHDFTYAPDTNGTSYVVAAKLDDIDNPALKDSRKGMIYGIDCDSPTYCLTPAAP